MRSLARTVADVRLKPGDGLVREGEPAAFFVIIQGRLRVVLDIHGKQVREFLSANRIPYEWIDRDC